MEYIVDAHSEETRPLITNFFAITDMALDPGECTRIFGINPTVTREATVEVPFPGRPPIEASWSIRFDKEPSWEIEEGLRKILNIIWPQRDKIVEFLSTTGFSALFGTNVTIHASRPLYVLSPQTLEGMSYFGAEYGLDIFDYSE